MRLYFDCCCYNRPFDDLAQQRVHDESEAILSLIARAVSGGQTILGSTVLKMEIDKIKDNSKREKVLALYSSAKECIDYTSAIQSRARDIVSGTSIHKMDALHIASAECGKADVFLTTDDKLLRACRGLELKVKVQNPVKCLAEVIENDGY